MTDTYTPWDDDEPTDETETPNDIGPDVCPVCEEDYNHRISNGYRNEWDRSLAKVAVCTPDNSAEMYVHVVDTDDLAEKVGAKLEANKMYHVQRTHPRGDTAGPTTIHPVDGEDVLSEYAHTVMVTGGADASGPVFTWSGDEDEDD